MKAQTKLMTQGSVSRHLLEFSVPIFVGQLFQQLYNTFDALIVGNFLDSNALAAVSSAGYLIFFFIGFFMGLSMGAGVVISNYIGAQDSKKVEVAVHTTVALGLITSLLLTVLGVFLAPWILRLMDTPEVLMEDSVAYFRIYFAGAAGSIMYNIFVGILRAAGDGKNPLYFLIISSIVNVLLDLLFIAVFNMGVGSAALATVISQFLSAWLCLRLLMKADADYRVKIKNIRFDVPMLGKIINFGVPAGIQNSVIGLANVVVQSNINHFGPMAMAGHGAYSKIEGFAFLPITSFTMSMTTFIGQNMGAREYKRVRQGSVFGTLCCVLAAELIGVCIFFFAKPLIMAFDRTESAVEFGIGRARVCALFYCLLAFTHAFSSILRGEGKSFVPMVIMLMFWCVFRVSLLTLWEHYSRTIQAVNWIYPITWSLSSIAFVIYYIIFNPLKKLEGKVEKENQHGI